MPFKKALLYARPLKLKYTAEWEQWSNAPPANVPSHTDRTYTHYRWQGYGHWLGTGNVDVPEDHTLLQLHVPSTFPIFGDILMEKLTF